MSDMLLVARAMLLDSRASHSRLSEWTEAEVAAFELRRQRRTSWRPFTALFGAAALVGAAAVGFANPSSKKPIGHRR